MASAAQRKLTELMESGLDVYPRSALSAIPRGTTFTPAPSGKVWGGLGRLGATARASVAQRDAALERAVKWVQKTFPDLYDAAMRRVNKGLGGLSDQSGTNKAGNEPSAWERVVNAIQTIAPEIIKAKAQKDLLEVQLDRARQGLPPLDARQYAPAVNVGLDPALVTQTVSEASETMKPLIWAGAAALGALVLLTAMRGSGRRR